MIFEKYIDEYADAFDSTDRNMWNYEDGCVLIGLLSMYMATGNEKYFDVISRFADKYVAPDGTIRLYKSSEYNLDFIPSGRIFFPLYERTHDKKFKTAADILMNQLRHQPRTKSGSFWHKGIYPNQVWLDGLYMGLPFYLEYENMFGTGESCHDIVMQFENVRKYLYDENKHLYYHAWNESRDVFWADKKTGLSPNFWTRAIGWYLMALADIYEKLPNQEVIYKDTIRALWIEAINGVLLWQDKESGLFYQLTTLSEYKGNYLETSGSLMVAYSLLKGVNLGVFTEDKYIQAGLQILFSVEKRMFTFSHGKLSLGGICKGAGLGPDGNYRRNGSINYYLSEKVVCDEQKGVGVCMMAYAQWLKLKKSHYSKTLGYPFVEIFNETYDPIMPNEINKII